MYWILSNELVDEDNDADISGDINLDLGGQLNFDGGQKINSPIPKIKLVMNLSSRLGNMTDHLSISETTGLVFSSKLVELLKSLSIENIQYFDFEMLDSKSGEKFEDYKIANVIGLIDCVDMDKSELKFYESGDIKRIRRLILDESKINPEIKIFRLSNRKVLTLVHESIKNAFEESGITGCVFYKPEDYH